MRGVVSLAAALAIPITFQNGQPFPHRSLILFITFLVILLILLVQGLTLPYFIKRSRLFEAVDGAPDDEETKLKIKNELAVFTVTLLKEKHQQGLFKDPHLVHMVEQWERKIKQPDKFNMSAEARQHYLEVLDSQRKFLERLNKDNNLDETFIREQVYQIDLEEERVKLI